MKGKIKILFICHGNICRSPMAEFILKDMVEKQGLSDQFYIESAATRTEEIWNGIGNQVYSPARDELQKHGISCEGKRARHLEKSDYDKFDYLIGMESMNLRNMARMLGNDPENKISKLLDFSDKKGYSSRDIADPWYTGNFERTYVEVTEGCLGLLKCIATGPATGRGGNARG